jgi:uncharacterized protein YndB with AHSA1/START domain
MAETVETVCLDCPHEAVWEVLADFGAIGRWAPNVDHSCLTTQHREGPGTTRRVQVGRNALLERIVEWEPEHRLAYTIEGLPRVVRSVTNTWTLVESDGSTTVTLTSTVDTGPRPPRQLVARVVAQLLAKASRQMLAGLKAHLEEGS